MFHTGLVSISFRGNTAEELIQAAKETGITAIEWGSDVHVPAGDVQRAAQVKALCEKARIAIPEYGSYYYLAEAPETFQGVLACAKALGTNKIRIWGGKKSSDTLRSADYAALVEDARRICDLAPDMTLCLECHKNSVTDEYHTTLRFLQDVDRKNLKMFWQPNQFRDFGYNLDALKALLPYVESVHVFSWDREQKFPLAAMEGDWKQYLTLLKAAGVENYMLEFMHNNSLDSLGETTKTLKSWL